MKKFVVAGSALLLLIMFIGLNAQIRPKVKNYNKDKEEEQVSKSSVNQSQRSGQSVSRQSDEQPRQQKQKEQSKPASTEKDQSRSDSSPSTHSREKKPRSGTDSNDNKAANLRQQEAGRTNSRNADGQRADTYYNRGSYRYNDSRDAGGHSRPSDGSSGQEDADDSAYREWQASDNYKYYQFEKERVNTSSQNKPNSAVQDKPRKTEDQTRQIPNQNRPNQNNVSNIRYDTFSPVQELVSSSKTPLASGTVTDLNQIRSGNPDNTPAEATGWDDPLHPEYRRLGPGGGQNGYPNWDGPPPGCGPGDGDHDGHHGDHGDHHDGDHHQHHHHYYHHYYSFGSNWFFDWYYYPHLCQVSFDPWWTWNWYYPYYYCSWVYPPHNHWRPYRYVYIEPVFYYSFEPDYSPREYKGYLVRNNQIVYNERRHRWIDTENPYPAIDECWCDGYCPTRGYGIVVRKSNGNLAFYHLDRYGNRLARRLVERYGRGGRRVYVEVRGFLDHETHTFQVTSMSKVNWRRNIILSIGFGYRWQRPWFRH